MNAFLRKELAFNSESDRLPPNNYNYDAVSPLRDPPDPLTKGLAPQRKVHSKP